MPLCWQGDPDPEGHRLRTLKNALRKNKHIVAVFFECARPHPLCARPILVCGLLLMS